jgi:hypothetical protein
MGSPTILPVWFGGVTGVSNVIDISAVSAVVGLIMPPAWTPAIVTIEGSPNGADFYTMYDGMSTDLLKFSVPPGMLIAINPNRMRCCKALRLISGTRDSLVPQGDPREFGLVVEMATAAGRGS